MAIQQEAWDKRREQQRAAAERQRARRAAQIADPAFRQLQYDKARASQERQREKAIARTQSPEYQKHRQEVRDRKLLTATSSTAKTRKSIPSRGSKGRTPTASERRVMNAIGALPCIACYLHGKVTAEVSLHHIDGRTAEGAHSRILPLCIYHHQHAAPSAIREEFPWLVPVHAAGNVGGRAEFERLNAGQRELLDRAYDLAGIERLTNTN